MSREATGTSRNGNYRR